MVTATSSKTLTVIRGERNRAHSVAKMYGTKTYRTHGLQVLLYLPGGCVFGVEVSRVVVSFLTSNVNPTKT